MCVIGKYYSRRQQPTIDVFKYPDSFSLFAQLRFAKAAAEWQAHKPGFLLHNLSLAKKDGSTIVPFKLIDNSLIAYRLNHCEYILY